MPDPQERGVRGKGGPLSPERAVRTRANAKPGSKFQLAASLGCPCLPVGQSSPAKAPVSLVLRLWARTGRAVARISPPPASWSIPLIVAKASGAP